MKRALVFAAAFGLSATGAFACDFHKTAHSGQMTVASVQSDATAVDTKTSTASIVRETASQPGPKADAEE